MEDIFEEERNYMDEYAMALIAELIDNKVKCKVVPPYAVLNDMINRVVNDFKEALRARCKDKTLICHPSVNGQIMFEFTPSK